MYTAKTTGTYLAARQQATMFGPKHILFHSVAVVSIPTLKKKFTCNYIDPSVQGSELGPGGPLHMVFWKYYTNAIKQNKAQYGYKRKTRYNFTLFEFPLSCGCQHSGCVPLPGGAQVSPGEAQCPFQQFRFVSRQTKLNLDQT